MEPYRNNALVKPPEPALPARRVPASLARVDVAVPLGFGLFELCTCVTRLLSGHLGGAITPLVVAWIMFSYGLHRLARRRREARILRQGKELQGRVVSCERLPGARPSFRVRVQFDGDAAATGDVVATVDVEVGRRVTVAYQPGRSEEAFLVEAGR